MFHVAFEWFNCLSCALCSVHYVWPVDNNKRVPLSVDFPIQRKAEGEPGDGPRLLLCAMSAVPCGTIQIRVVLLCTYDYRTLMST